MKNIEVMSFKKVTSKDVLEFIAAARERIIFVKPSFMKNEVEALLDVAKHKGVSCYLFMEAGDNAIRYGFGETVALDLLYENIGQFNIQIADRIRIVVLVVDDRALVYMPNISFIEEESSELTFPNGFMCNENITAEIVNQFTAKKDNAETIKSLENGIIEKVENIFILPGGYIPGTSRADVKQDLENSIKRLKSNPAVDPAKLTKISFYRSNYKILKMQIIGVRIQNKKINLNPFYAMLPEVTEQLNSSWTILTAEDINSLQDTKIFDRELEKIKDQYKDYIFDAGRFGYIIDVKKKDEFTAAVTKLKEDFKKYLEGDPDLDPKIKEEVTKRFQIENDEHDANENVKKDLNTVLDESRIRLEEHLLKVCPTDNVFMTKVLHDYRHLKSAYKPGYNEEEILKEFVSLFVMNKLKFADVSDIVSKIDVKLDYFDVSDELIFKNEDFKILMDKYELNLRQTSEGYEGAKPCQPLP